MTVSFVLPIRIVSEANQREHWAVRNKRKRAQQEAVHLAWPMPRSWRISLPCNVKLTRMGPKRLDPDNLAGGFKHVQDAVAAELGVDDGDPGVHWVYEQLTGCRFYALRVEVTRCSIS